MKNSIKKATVKSTQKVSAFSSIQMDGKAMKMVKGGEDIIIVEDTMNI